MRCDEAEALIPSYLDGELQESQAAPLRRHLLDCQSCRAGAQREKNLKRWFQRDEHAAIPQGFAARIARRALAGDTGQPEIEIVPAAPAAAIRGHHGTATTDVVRTHEDPILRFVLQATAAAALVVLALSFALRSQSLPSGTSLRAADGRGEISVEQALERLDELNRRDPDAAKPSRPADPAGSGDSSRSEEPRRP